MSKEFSSIAMIRRVARPTLLAVFVVSFLILPQMVLAAWVENTTNPPLTGVQPTFLNGSSAAQRKDGSLLLGSSSRNSKLCLNADPGLAISNSSNSNCIDSWVDVATVSGPFVRRQLNGIVTNQNDPTTYGSADAGFAAVTGLSSNNQYLSTVVKINAASSSPVKYAVYATDGGADTRSAAQLSGKTVVKNATGTAQLCLNGQCISRWSDVNLFAATSVIRLQSGTYLDSDAGQATVSGVLWLQRGLTAGRPTSATPFTWTNTDGQCTTENGETLANSPVDCN